MWKIKIAYLPSSTPEKLAIQVIQEEARNNYDYFIIFGGICSFTSQLIIRRECRLHYQIDETMEVKVNCIIDTIRDLYNILKGRHSVCTIPPPLPNL